MKTLDAGTRAAAAVALALASSSLSCTRMPTAPQPVILVTGHVLDPRGGSISGVMVVFEAVGARFGDGTTADKTGRYRITLEPGDYDVWFAIGSYVYPGGGRVLVSPKNPTMDFTLEGFHIRGTVLDAAGGRGERLRVGAGDYDFAARSSEVINGDYSFFIPGGTYTFEVMGEDYHPILTTDSVPVQADTTLDFRLDRFPVEGVVRGANGTADQGAYITTGETSAETDAAGRYVFYPPSGEILIHCFSHDYSVLGRTVGPITIAGPTTVDFDLRGVSWTGTVRRQETTHPAEGYLVVASVGPVNDRRSAVSRVSETGDFHLVIEPGLGYDLEVWSDEMPRLRLYHQSFVATADTSFQLYVTSTPIP